MADLLQIEDFKPHVGKIFRFKGTRFAMPLERVITNDNPPLPGAKRRPFILIFRAPKEREYMPDGIYECEVGDGRTYRMYVNPVHTTEPEWQDYQAAFS